MFIRIASRQSRPVWNPLESPRWLLYPPCLDPEPSAYGLSQTSCLQELPPRDQWKAQFLQVAVLPRTDKGPCAVQGYEFLDL